MKDINNIMFSDFYFNGKWLSDFNAEVGGKNGNFALPLTPQLDIKSEENAIGLDGSIVYGARYQPRTFTVPIVLNDLTKIRDISAWLSSKIEKAFYWKNDTVQINCIVNNLNDLERSGLSIGATEIKFIAHNPYYSAIIETPFTYTSFASGISLVNQGNVESYPLIHLEGSGDITVNINGDVFKVKAVSGYVDVDCIYQTCAKATVNKYSDFEGVFTTLKVGTNLITVTTSGTCTKLIVTPRSRWI